MVVERSHGIHKLVVLEMEIFPLVVARYIALLAGALVVECVE
jgi:hypothetical protein